jgi:hypothetical protein
MVTNMPASGRLRLWLWSACATGDMRVPFFLCDAVLVDETTIGARDRLATHGTYDGFRFLEEHIV